MRQFLGGASWPESTAGFRGRFPLNLVDSGPARQFPADRGESTEADRLIPHLGGGYLLDDALSDRDRRYDLAMAQGHQLIAPPKRPGKDPGHGYQGPHRLRGPAPLAGPFGRAVSAARGDIERRFGHLTSFGGGLAGLPSWGRRSGRVGMWVEAKLLLNGVRALLDQRLTA